MDGSKYIGKHLLFGITYVDADDQVIDQMQSHGTITRIDENGVFIELANGETFSLPPSLESLHPAKPGVYRLRSTGGAVENPDFVSTWTVRDAPKWPRNSD